MFTFNYGFNQKCQTLLDLRVHERIKKKAEEKGTTSQSVIRKRLQSQSLGSPLI